MVYLGGSGPGSLMRLYVARCWSGLQSSGGLTGVGGSASQNDLLT